MMDALGAGYLLSVPPTPAAAITALQATPTPASGVGPDELVQFWPPVVRVAWFLAGFLVAALLGWYVVEPAVARLVRRRNRNNPTLTEAISRYVRALVLVAALFVGAGTAGFGGFLGNSALVIAAVTLAIGVAGQEVIGSLVSGLALVVDPEFNVGDYIQWSDGEGTVQSITLRVTRVLTQDGELVTVPNTALTSQSITRPFGRGRYRLVERIGVDYEEDVDEAISRVEAAAAGVEGILHEPPPVAYVEELADDEVVLRVHCWIQDPRRRDVVAIRSAFARAVKAHLEAAGVEISPATKREIQGRIGVDQIGYVDRRRAGQE